MAFRRLAVLSIVQSVTLPLSVYALGTGQPTLAPDAPPPSAIEQALIERSCRSSDSGAAIEAHRQCLDTQLASMREEFGRDLNRLSAVQRRKVDAACSRLRAGEQREAYLDCLGTQLSGLHVRQSHPTAPVAADTATDVVAAPATVNTAPPVEQARRVSSWALAGTVTGALGILLGGGFFAFKTLRSRRVVVHACRVCGVQVPASGLCPTCRHEAAETVRRATAERAHQQKALEDEERRQRELEAEQELQRARDQEEAFRQAQELALQQQEQHQQIDIVEPTAHVVPEAPAAVAITPSAPVPAADEPFDPYVVLGVPAGATGDDIRKAYQDARSKYDPDLVSHLGYEAQEHFKLKVESVERAYQMLSHA